MRYIISLVGLLPLATAQIACIAAITTTMQYLPALAPHAGACPVDEAKNISYNLLEGDTKVCCTRAALASSRTVEGKGIGCCPCGALCTGGLPTVMEWTLDAAGLSTISKSKDSSVTATSATTTKTGPAITTTITNGAATGASSTASAAGPTTSTSLGNRNTAGHVVVLTLFMGIASSLW